MRAPSEHRVRLALTERRVSPVASRSMLLAALAVAGSAAGCRRATPTPDGYANLATRTASAVASDADGQPSMPSMPSTTSLAHPSSQSPTSPAPTSMPTNLVPPLHPSAPTAAAPADGTALPSPNALLGRRLEGGALGGTYRLVEVRTGRHPGFTRIVWAMEEAQGAPRWSTLMRDDVEGTAVIDVLLSDTAAVEHPEALAAQAVDSPVVDSVQPRRIADDAMLAFSVRLARPAGYTVTLLQSPVRVVIDVADPADAAGAP